jgi:hypothetical protein
MLGDSGLGHTASPRQLNHGDLIGPDDPLEYGATGGIGERAHDGVNGGCFIHINKLAYTNQLVNANLSTLTYPGSE